MAVPVREGETEGVCARVWETGRVHDAAAPVTEELAAPLAVGEGVGVHVGDSAQRGMQAGPTEVGGRDISDCGPAHA